MSLLLTANERNYPQLFNAAREAGRAAGLRYASTPWVEADQLIAIAATSHVGPGRTPSLNRELRSAFLIEASKAAIDVAADEEKKLSDTLKQGAL